MSQPIGAFDSLSLRFILKPLVRFCLHRAFRLQDIYQILKVVFVEVAAEELRLTNQRSNASRISLMTGVYREDIPELLSRIGERIDGGHNILARVIGQWEQDAEFCLRSGETRVLVDGDENSSFHRLVKKVSRSAYPPTIAQELLRIGAVIRTRRGLRLIKQGVSVHEDERKGYELLGNDLDALILSAEHNISSRYPEGELYLRTEYDNIFHDALPEIRRWLMDRGKQFHREVRDFLSRHDKDLSSSRSRNRAAGQKVIVHAFGVCVEETQLRNR